MFTKLNLNGGKVFFTSDPHFGHTNLTKGCSSWKDKSTCRDFPTVDIMSQAILDGINNYVGENDTLIGGGDFSFNGKNNVWNYRKQIKCKNIYWTYGNHDHHIYNNAEVRVPYSELDLYKSIADPRFHPSHQTFESPDYFTVRLKTLFKSVDKEHWFRINGQDYVVHHWPCRSWFNSQDGSILAYGHEHAQVEDEPWGLSIDTGMDNAFRLYGEYRVFDEEMIKDQLKDRTIYKHGHH